MEIIELLTSSFDIISSRLKDKSNLISDGSNSIMPKGKKYCQ